MNTFPLFRAVGVLLFLFLVISGLYFTREFFVPVAIAGILAMLFLPLSRRMERRGMHRAVATILCILILLGVVAGIAGLLSWQVSDLAEDASKMQERGTQMLDKLRGQVSNTLGITPEKQKEMMEQQRSGSSGKTGSIVAAVLGSLMNILVKTVLVIVYMFLLMFFRGHLKKFVLKLVPPDDKKKSETILQDASKVAQKYLSGMGMMIACLWVMYGIGFSIVGVKNALFFAILCGLLEIVPFVGNLTGTGLTLLMATAQGGGGNMILGVLATYLVVQFIQSYLLEPLVVGAEVNINPLFTILVIVAGEMIWGVPGMILAIPILGIVKIICDHVEPLQPYGFLIGEEKKQGEDSGLKKKIKNLFSRNKNK